MLLKIANGVLWLSAALWSIRVGGLFFSQQLLQILFGIVHDTAQGFVKFVHLGRCGVFFGIQFTQPLLIFHRSFAESSQLSAL